MCACSKRGITNISSLNLELVKIGGYDFPQPRDWLPPFYATFSRHRVLHNLRYTNIIRKQKQIFYQEAILRMILETTCIILTKQSLSTTQQLMFSQQCEIRLQCLGCCNLQASNCIPMFQRNIQFNPKDRGIKFYCNDGIQPEEYMTL